MPAILTHHLFGEDASAFLPEGFLTGQEELLAFLLGNQGTDLLWARFATLPATSRACRSLAAHVHEERVVPFLFALRSSVARLPHKDESIGRAFVLGMAAHFLLDSVVHPLVFAHIAQLQEADPTLRRAQGELHAMVEADIDSWLLWQKRHTTILETPISRALSSTERVDLVVGTLVSLAAQDVFGIGIRPAEYARCRHDYLMVYRLIDPPAKLVPRTLGRFELGFRDFSRIAAQRHPIVAADECPSANLDHLPWHDPATGALSVASFPDLFHDALLAWPAFASRMIEGDRRRVTAMVDGLNYYGRLARL